MFNTVTIEGVEGLFIVLSIDDLPDGHTSYAVERWNPNAPLNDNSYYSLAHHFDTYTTKDYKISEPKSFYALSFAEIQHYHAQHLKRDLIG